MIKKVYHKLFKDKSNRANKALPNKCITDKLDFSNFKVVFDIGAYHGTFTENLFSKNPRMEIHAFEPFIKSYEIVKKKFNKKNVTVNNLAVSDFTGTNNLFLNSFDQTNSLLESNFTNSMLDRLTKNINFQAVQIITLDDYCEQLNLPLIDFIKIDTQGNSYNVLVGAEQLLLKKKITHLYVETEFIEIYKNQKCFSEIEILLKKMDYQLVDFFDINYTADGRIAWCDSLFIAKR